MKTLRFAPLTALLAAGPALAHPGHHAEAGLSKAMSHVAASPFHLGMIALAAVAAGLGVIWAGSRLKSARQRSRRG